MTKTPPRSGRAALLTATVLVFAGIAIGAAYWLANEPDVADPPTKPVVLADFDPWTPRSDAGFVGSEACVECHDEIAEQYQKHPMMIALQPITAKHMAKPSGGFSSGPGIEYRVETKDGKTRHFERGVDAAGNEIFDQGVDITHVLGAGVLSESFLHERDGRLFASSISWYTVPQKWGLAPGYNHLRHHRFDRPVADRCLGCHSGRLNYKEPTDEFHVAYDKPIFIEQGIGCERCHGPGREHIAYHDDGEGDEDPMLNLAELTPSKRDAVCNQCHVVGVQEFLRVGRTNADFRPGDDVGDIWTVYVPTETDQDASEKAVSQVVQITASTCFKKSNGQLNCVLCHDPHIQGSLEERTVRHNKACQSCHESEDCAEQEPVRKAAPANDSCIHCHMRTLAPSDIPHAPQTDHRILRSFLPRLGQTVAKDDSRRNLKIYNLEHTPLPPLVKQRTDAVLLVQEAIKARDTDLAKRAEKLLVEVAEAAPDDALTLYYLGKARAKLDQPTEAMAAWRKILESNPAHEQALSSLAIAAEVAGDAAAAEKYWDQLIEIQPWDPEHRFLKARLLSTQNGRSVDAAQAVLAAIELNPVLQGAYELAIPLLRRLGRFEEAAKLEKDAKTIFLPRR